jgi:predicted ATPase
LQTYATDHPLRERFYELLMVAQYRSGRQAEALRSFDLARQLLIDELGVEPGPALRRLQRQVLEQAATLEWQPPEPALIAPATHVSSDVSAGSRPRPMIPMSIGPLFGRAAHLDRIAALLSCGRIVTLTGPAGAGKTAVAAELARRIAAQRSAWFVDLDGVEEDELVPLAIASAVGSPTTPNADPLDSLAKAISTQPGLLILDTCEHVIDGVARTASGLLARTDALQILATSRRPLSVRGELAWPIPPLQLPTTDMSLSELAAVPSVSLFVERAVAVRPDFELTERNAPDVSALCVALDGLPLAIELAAARVDALTPAAIRQRLNDRFSLLVEGGRDAAPRQQTLRAAIDWSIALLSPAQRDAFARLSVFAGPFGLDDAIEIAGSPADDAVTHLASLVRQSMIAVVGDDRYQLLDTLREYGRELLDTEGIADELYERHARHFVRIAALGAEGLWSSEQVDFVNRLRAALPDMRAAIRWAATHDQHELGARIIGSLSWFFMLEGMSTEGLGYLASAEHSSDRLSRFARAGIHYGICVLSSPLGRLEEGRRAGETSVRLAREGGDTRTAAAALAALSVTEWSLGDFVSAARHQDEALALSDEADLWRRADVLVLRARTAMDQRDPNARQLLDRALALTETIGDLHAAGMGYAQLSLLHYRAEEFAEAIGAAKRSLAAHQALNEPEATAAALHVLGRAQLALGDVPASRAAHLRALDIALAIGHAAALCEAIEDFASILATEGDHQFAAALLELAETERQQRGIASRPVEREFVRRLRATVEAGSGPEHLPAVTLESALERIRASATSAPQQRGGAS